MTYSSSMSLGRQRFAQKGYNTTKYRTNERALGPVSNTIILVVLACLLGLLYLTQVTKTNRFGYQLDELNKTQQSLRQEHDELEVASARLQALDRVKNSQPAKNLVSTAPTATIQN